MKNYILEKINLFGIEMGKVIYDFKIENTNSPTKWIKIIIHHGGNSNTIQKIIDLHIKKNRWSTIGYHFLISKTGKIYYSRKLDVAGAHCFGYNKNSIGIALLGNLDLEKPTLKQIESLKILISKLEKQFHIKKIFGHNRAIYKLMKEKYYKINFPKLDLTKINSKDEFEKFSKQINSKILELDASKETIYLIKRFKTCPGVNMYKILKELEKF